MRFPAPSKAFAGLLIHTRGRETDGGKHTELLCSPKYLVYCTCMRSPQDFAVLKWKCTIWWSCCCLLNCIVCDNHQNHTHVKTVQENPVEGLVHQFRQDLLANSKTFWFLSVFEVWEFGLSSSWLTLKTILRLCVQMWSQVVYVFTCMYYLHFARILQTT